jgi:hypothetical protein
MSTNDEYVQRAEECERLAAACRSQSNREMLQAAAVQWRKMAKESAVGDAPSQVASARVPGSVDRDRKIKG